MTSNRKYQKYLSKYQKGVGIDYREIVKSFERQYASKEVNVIGLADLNGVAVISVSTAREDDMDKIPDTYRGITVRKSIAN